MVYHYTPISAFKTSFQLFDVFRCSEFYCFFDDASCEYFWPVEWNQLYSVMFRLADRWKRVGLVCLWYISIAEVDGTVLPSGKQNNNNI